MRGQSTSWQWYAKSLPIFTKINNSIFDKKNSLILDCFLPIYSVSKDIASCYRHYSGSAHRRSSEKRSFHPLALGQDAAPAYG